MAYVSVPKDLSTVKTKVMFNLTKRQLICFSLAFIVGLPFFFIFKESAGTSLATLVMIFVMLPFFMFAMYEKHGQPLEVILKHYIEVRFIKPKQRPYKTDNFYAALMRQNRLDKEVKEIVTKKQIKQNEQSEQIKAYKGRQTRN